MLDKETLLLTTVKAIKHSKYSILQLLHLEERNMLQFRACFALSFQKLLGEGANSSKTVFWRQKTIITYNVFDSCLRIHFFLPCRYNPCLQGFGAFLNSNNQLCLSAKAQNTECFLFMEKEKRQNSGPSIKLIWPCAGSNFLSIWNMCKKKRKQINPAKDWVLPFENWATPGQHWYLREGTKLSNLADSRTSHHAFTAVVVWADLYIADNTLWSYDIRCILWFYVCKWINVVCTYM